MARNLRDCENINTSTGFHIDRITLARMKYRIIPKVCVAEWLLDSFGLTSQNLDIRALWLTG